MRDTLFAFSVHSCIKETALIPLHRNTANQIADKRLHIRRYYTQPDQRALFSIDRVDHCIFYGILI